MSSCRATNAKVMRVPAQMALAEAKKNRRANPRTLQDVGKDVEP